MAFDGPIVALTCYCEASSASPMERRCVVHSIFNRAKLNPVRYGKTPAAVCLKRYQYSEFLPDQADNANLERGAVASDSDPVMQDCLAAFHEVVTGTSFDQTGGATHYTDKSIAPPAWTEGAEMCLETPKFRFYRKVP